MQLLINPLSVHDLLLSLKYSAAIGDMQKPIELK